MHDPSHLHGPLWSFFRELRRTVERANAGRGSHPYRRGDFLVRATTDDVELTLRDVSEEDAILIASELASLGAGTEVLRLVPCPSCEARVPAGDRCDACDAPSAPGGPDAAS